MSNIVLEKIHIPERFNCELTQENIKNAIAFVLDKIDSNLEAFTYKFPTPASIDGIYQSTDNIDWTTSFWTGMLLLAYEITNDKKYLDVANIHLQSFKIRIQEKQGTDTHDLGFLYTLSSVANYKLTHNEEAKEIALLASKELMKRYFHKAGIIQAWGDLNDINNRGRMIIDCCMNLPLLYWATEISGDSSYYNAAYSHARQASKYIIRDDSSTFHTYYMNVETGEPKYGKTCQGFSDASCWSRGQAWGIYGFPLSYNYTEDYTLIESSKELANYFLNRLPEDNICYWDLVFTDGIEERDSSAAAIAACGLLELSKHLNIMDEDKTTYEKAAKAIILSLSQHYTTNDLPHSNGILKHAVYGKPQNDGVDECCIWGDYFYFEALVRLSKNWQLYW